MFDYRPGEDVFACVADLGWITGHTYVVYGPLCNGGTTVLFESTVTYPNPGMFSNLSPAVQCISELVLYNKCNTQDAIIATSHGYV